MPPRKLTSEVQIFIVKCLAAFMSPTEVSEAVKDEFNVSVDRQLVRCYNPMQVNEQSEKWKDLFWAEREKFINSTENYGISHQSYRLKQLAYMERQARRKKNFPLAAQLHEQAAKERGGAYTNRREVSGPQGGAIPIQVEEKKKVLIESMIAKWMKSGAVKTREEGIAKLIALDMGITAGDFEEKE